MLSSWRGINLNLIDYQSNIKVRDFVNLIFQHSLVVVVNKSTRFAKSNVTFIDYLITNSFNDQENLTDTSDRFPIITISMKHRLDSSDKKVTMRKRVINAVSIQGFKDMLSDVDWRDLYLISNPSDPMNILAFPLKTISDDQRITKSLDDQRAFTIV